MQKKVLPFSLKASGWAISNLGRLFPRLAARIFFRLYTTPPKKKLGGALVAIRQKAVVGSVELSKYAFDPGKLKIATYRWGGDRDGGNGSDKGDDRGDRRKRREPAKKVLLMHGWGGTALGFPDLIRALAASGYEVVAFDAPAHGSSDGRGTNLVQWMHVFDQFLRQEGPFHAIIGHSVGALVSALTVARGDHRMTRVIMASPPLSAPAFFQDTFTLFNIPPKVIAHVYGLVESRLKDDLRSMDLGLCVDRIGADRLLLLYDERDQLVKHADIASFLAERPGVRAFRIEGHGHFRILKDPSVIQAITSFLVEDYSPVAL